MRDKKDHATLDLVGFDQPATNDEGATDAVPSKRAPRPRQSGDRPSQQQLELLAPTDASGLPLWQRDAALDLTGLPVWAAA